MYSDATILNMPTIKDNKRLLLIVAINALLTFAELSPVFFQ